MPQSSLQFVTYAIADAMLAGPPEATAMVERMTLVLGERADWMNGFVTENNAPQHMEAARCSVTSTVTDFAKFHDLSTSV